jgi:tellurite resistance protein TehA-like permease
VVGQHWVNMGAMAIATLAGARLEEIAGSDPLLTRLLPAIFAATLLCWSVANRWILLLLLMTIWRHAMRGMPLSYRSDYLSMVFPLSMYTAAASAFVRVNGLDFLSWIPRLFVWVAVVAWGAAFAGMLRAALLRR